ncbi:MAG: methyltransferase family protein [Candidatus Pelagibacterales bacterium]|jgi:protein-S-isoprenylcysteine O-methyltransferase Ste14|tara:strand:+ start:378 stop:854 length:477 start_codon:yes stop_codon:yes gene_type:complete
MIFKKSKAAQVWFFPPYLVFLGLIISFLLEFLVYRNQIFDNSIIFRFLGIILTIAAILLFVKSVRIFNLRKEKIHPRSISTQIFKDGPFQFSRNPIYLAMFVLLIGVGLTLNSFWFLYSGLVVAIMIHYGVIIPEENYLEKEFGKDYLEYKKTVRRWL